MGLLATVLAGCPNDENPTGPSGPVDLSTLGSVVEGRPGGAFFSTWNSGPSNVWVVGGGKEKAIVLQYDGSAWTEHDTGLGHQLWWVHGFDGGPLYVSGANGVIGKYDGGAWTRMDSTVPNTVFFGIWGASPNDMWAVSGTWVANSAVDPVTDVVLRYDGSAWSRVIIPALDAKTEDDPKDLFKVWGADADHVFIVGSGGLALHYDGTQWRREKTGINDQLLTVAGRSATDVYAVGTGTHGPPLIHWDGSRWTSLPTSEFAPQQMPGLWTAPGEPVYVAGVFGYTARLTDDGVWQEGDLPHSNGYHAIRGDGAGAIWAVGGNLFVSLNPDKGDIALAGATAPAP